VFVRLCVNRERLSEMREAYIREAELSPTSPAPTVDCVTSTDPFYDRFPWFRLVARLMLAKTLRTPLMLPLYRYTIQYNTIQDEAICSARH